MFRGDSPELDVFHTVGYRAVARARHLLEEVVELGLRGARVVEPVRRALPRPVRKQDGDTYACGVGCRFSVIRAADQRLRAGAVERGDDGAGDGEHVIERGWRGAFGGGQAGGIEDGVGGGIIFGEGLSARPDLPAATLDVSSLLGSPSSHDAMDAPVCRALRETGFDEGKLVVGELLGGREEVA